LTGIRAYVIFFGSFVVVHSYAEKRAPETCNCDGKTGKRGFKMYEAKCDVSVGALNRSLKGA